MEGQQFCLRWHNFQNTLLGTLPKLLDGGYLTDVTLSAGGRHIHAHRIILSACSYYFKELFKDLNTLQHPVIILPGMEYANLCALVTFMYNGEVNIYQEQLPALLAMADTLHIRGLADIAGKTSRYENRMNDPSVNVEEKNLTDMTIKKEAKENVSNESLEPLPLDNYALTSNADEESSSNDLDVPCSVKTKPYYSINAKLNTREKKPISVNVPFTKQQQQQQQTDAGEISCGITNQTTGPSLDDNCSLLENAKPPPMLETNFKFLTNAVTNRISQSCNKGNVTCLVCGKQLSNQYNLRVHMETHSNSSYSCTACSHVSRSRDALRKHVSYRHPVTASQKRPRTTLPMHNTTYNATKP